MGDYIDGEAWVWKPDLGAAQVAIDFAKKVTRFNSKGQE